MTNQEDNNYFGGWPTYIIYDGRKVYCSSAETNVAGYTLPSSYMNKIIWISKEEIIQHNKSCEN